MVGVDKAAYAPHDTVQRNGLPSPPVRAGNNGNLWIQCGEGVRDDGGRTGAALLHPVVALSCAAIPLAAAAANKGEVGHGGGLAHNDDHGNARGNYESDDDGNAAAAAATLPHFWWSALDVSTRTLRTQWTRCKVSALGKGGKMHVG